MSKFYSILLEDEMHDALKRKSFETGEHISSIVRRGISIVLKNMVKIKAEPNDSKAGNN